MARQGRQGLTTDRLRRIAACRRDMKKVGAQALLLTNEPDYHYVSGFSGEESAVLVTPRDVFLVTDRRFEEQIKSEAPWAKQFMRRGLLNAEIARACLQLKVSRLAVQGDHLTLADRDEIAGLVKGVKIVPTSRLVAGLRKIKSEDELKLMAKAIRIAEEAYKATLSSIKTGQTELEMAARLEYEMKCRGSLRPAFPTICAEGPNAALPHARPGTRKVKRGSSILFDWGARWHGYNSDLTRVVFIGSIPAKLGEIYKVVLDAQLAAIEAVAPGRRMCDVDAVARGLIDKAGFGHEFSHGLGHGLGLDVHESPSLSWRSEEELRPGMLVTVEPGIYVPGLGGVRIEDDVVVTDRGCRVLTHLSKKLDDAVL